MLLRLLAALLFLPRRHLSLAPRYGAGTPDDILTPCPPPDALIPSLRHLRPNFEPTPRLHTCVALYSRRLVTSALLNVPRYGKRTPAYLARRKLSLECRRKDVDGFGLKRNFGGSRHAGVNPCMGLGWKRILLEAGTLEHEGAVLEVLLKHKRCLKLTATDAVVRAITKKFDYRMMGILLDRQGTDVQITEEVLKAGAENYRYGKNVMTILPNRPEADFQITKEVVKAAAKNGGSGKENDPSSRATRNRRSDYRRSSKSSCDKRV